MQEDIKKWKIIVSLDPLQAKALLDILENSPNTPENLMRLTILRPALVDMQRQTTEILKQLGVTVSLVIPNLERE